MKPIEQLEEAITLIKHLRDNSVTVYTEDFFVAHLMFSFGYHVQPNRDSHGGTYYKINRSRVEEE